MSSSQYGDLVRVVSGLLYGYDPDGMGSSVFAPEDEYDAPARRIISDLAERKSVGDVAALVRASYPEASGGLCAAIGSAWLLYRSGQPVRDVTRG